MVAFTPNMYNRSGGSPIAFMHRGLADDSIIMCTLATKKARHATKENEIRSL
jgi:hypothetical protein